MLDYATSCIKPKMKKKNVIVRNQFRENAYRDDAKR